MSYTINKTDGSVLTEVVDGTIDQTATDITLVGKNSTSYGEFLNENFVKMLENFANTTQPNNPIAGQLWFDTSENRLKVYDGGGFKVSGGTIVSTTQPSSFSQGDIWIDSRRRQLYFHDGVSGVLAGPVYSQQQGIAGFQIVDQLDSNGNSHTINLLWLSGQIIGVWSLSQFVPATNSLPGFSLIKVGFNGATGIKLHATADSADSLIDGQGNNLTADNFLNTGDTNGFQSTSNTLILTNPTPVQFGAGGTAGTDEITVSRSLFSFNSTTLNQNFQVSLLNTAGNLPSIYVNANSEFVGIYTNTPTATFDVNGDTRIRGNLTVEGTTTTINTQNTVIEDKLIELGATDSPTDSTANGGGILLRGSTDKTISYNNSILSWSSSENFNVVTGKGYYINGIEVLNRTTLSTSVTDAQGLQRIGKLDSLQADVINLNNNVISIVDVTSTDKDIVITPLGAGSVDVSSKRIVNVQNPNSNTDAANLQTVNSLIAAKPVGMSADTTGLTTSQIKDIIEKVFPASEHAGGTCRIWCIELGQARIYTVISGAWSGGSIIP